MVKSESWCCKKEIQTNFLVQSANLRTAKAVKFGSSLSLHVARNGKNWPKDSSCLIKHTENETRNLI